MTSTRRSLWSFFDNVFLIFCYLLVFAGISSFFLIQIVMRREK